MNGVRIRRNVRRKFINRHDLFKQTDRQTVTEGNNEEKTKNIKTIIISEKIENK